MFFRPPCLKSEAKVLFFAYGLEGHREVFCILSSSLIISVGTFDFNERKTIFEVVKVLKTTLLPSSVRGRIHQTFKTFLILVMLLRKFFFILLFLVVRKVDYCNFYGMITQIITFDATSFHFQTFQYSNTCNLAFFMIWFQPEYFENIVNVLNSFLIDLLSLKKKVVSSA